MSETIQTEGCPVCGPRNWLLLPVVGLPENEEENPWWPWYDKAFGYIICADSEEEARQMAHDDLRSSDLRERQAWLLAKYSTCTDLTTNREKGIVLRDYKAA